MTPARPTPPATPHTGVAAPEPARVVRPQATPARPAVDSQALLGGARSVDIVHQGAVYRLQATRLGKLILTK